MDEDQRLTDVYVVGNNDDGAYRFIAARFHMSGLPWQVLTWATASEDLDESARINAVDEITRIFSIWDRPLGGRRGFDPKYHDDIRAAWKCVDAPFASATPGRFLLGIVVAAALLLLLAHIFWDRPLGGRRDFDLSTTTTFEMPGSGWSSGVPWQAIRAIGGVFFLLVLAFLVLEMLVS